MRTNIKEEVEWKMENGELSVRRGLDIFEQKMIEDEIKFLEALQLGFIAKDFITPSKKDKVTEKFVKKRLEELKSSLGKGEGK
jgi:hypothetical protein